MIESSDGQFDGISMLISRHFLRKVIIEFLNEAERIHPFKLQLGFQIGGQTRSGASSHLYRMYIPTQDRQKDDAFDILTTPAPRSESPTKQTKRGVFDYGG